jgi:hypothetical protein
MDDIDSDLPCRCTLNPVVGNAESSQCPLTPNPFSDEDALASPVHVRGMKIAPNLVRGPPCLCSALAEAYVQHLAVWSQALGFVAVTVTAAAVMCRVKPDLVCGRARVRTFTGITSRGISTRLAPQDIRATARNGRCACNGNLGGAR